MSTPTIKVICDGISIGDAQEILAKSREDSYAGCKFDDPLVEEILELFDVAYQNQLIGLMADVIVEIKNNVD